VRPNYRLRLEPLTKGEETEMKTLTMLVAATTLGLGVLVGCSPEKTEPASPQTSQPSTGNTPTPRAATGAPLGSVKIGDMALCAVCAVKDGTTEKEEVKATLDYKGKTYAFCNVDEKAEFISNASKYADTSQ
jgi:YHS domain-containing protein